MMKEMNVKKRRIVIAAVIFLIIALLLTFFSNTIMNANLPEVRAQYVTAGTVTEKVSGQGTVTAGGTVSVTTKYAGTIDKLKVEEGDEVKKGDVICTLKPETEESSGDGDTSYDDAYYTTIEDYLGMGYVYDEAEKQLQKDQAALEAEINETYQLNDKTSASARSAAIRSAQTTLENATANATADSYEKLPKKYQDKIADAVSTQKNAEKAEEAAQTASEEAAGNVGGDSESAAEEVESAQKQAEKDYTAYTDAVAAYNTAVAQGADADELEELQATMDSALETYEADQEALSDAKTNLSEVKSAEATAKSAESALTSAQKAKEKADEAVTEAEEATVTEMTKDGHILALMLLDMDGDDVETDEDGLISVYAESEGTVSDLRYAVGDSVSAEDTIVTIVPEDATYRLTITVDADKAKRLKNGTEATVINADAEATLIAIRNAQGSSGGSSVSEKNLVFEMTGDITDGQEVSVKVDLSSKDYVYTVPASAVNEDSDGKFVLAILTKSTPLGNHYYVKKIEVEQEATDGTTTAISGQIDNDTYVICTSSQSISPGDMVKMQETVDNATE